MSGNYPPGVTDNDPHFDGGDVFCPDCKEAVCVCEQLHFQFGGRDDVTSKVASLACGSCLSQAQELAAREPRDYAEAGPEDFADDAGTEFSEDAEDRALSWEDQTAYDVCVPRFGPI